jgi:hypothetical protein
MTSSISQADQANQMRRAWPVAVACRASIIGSSIAWLLLVGPRHATHPLVRRRQGIGIFKSPPCSLVLKPFRLQSARRTPMQHRAGTITIFCLWLRSSIGGVTRLPLQPAHTERERCVERNVEKVLDSSNYWVACTGLAGRAQPLRLRHHGWVGEQRIGSLADSPQRLRSPNRAPGSQPH